MRMLFIVTTNRKCIRYFFYRHRESSDISLSIFFSLISFLGFISTGKKTFIGSVCCPCVKIKKTNIKYSSLKFLEA